MVDSRVHLAVRRWKDLVLLGGGAAERHCSGAEFSVDHSMIAVARRRFVYVYSKEAVGMHISGRTANMGKLPYLSSAYGSRAHRKLPAEAEVIPLLGNK